MKEAATFKSLLYLSSFVSLSISRSTTMVFLKFFTFLCFFFPILFSVSESIVSKPHIVDQFDVSRIQTIQSFGSCTYTVIISTSCSSPRYTRDQISLAFGDRYGHQIYAPRLDDPGTRAFEQCSSDTFEINGPCTNQICYVYLYRSGPDGWIPRSVQIFSYSSKAVTFSYNTYVPESIWYGHNYCNTISDSKSIDFNLRKSS